MVTEFTDDPSDLGLLLSAELRWHNLGTNPLTPRIGVSGALGCPPMPLSFWRKRWQPDATARSLSPCSSMAHGSIRQPTPNPDTGSSPPTAPATAFTNVSPTPTPPGMLRAKS